MKIRDEEAVLISTCSAFVSNNRYQMNAKSRAENEAGDILQCYWPKHIANKIVRRKISTFRQANSFVAKI